MYDYHTHTVFSDDGTASINEMIESAISKGVKEIAITDHYDPDYPDADYPEIIDLSEYRETLFEREKLYNGKIKVIKGIEIGIQSGETLLKCAAEADNPVYDFVLGSFHAAHNMALDTLYFKGDIDVYKRFNDFYTCMEGCLREYKNYDVVGHFNVVDRYHKAIDPYPCYDIIENILKIVIENGKGLEFNTSSFRYNMGENTLPSSRILRLFKALGGEIITIGSDAHNTADVGRGFTDAVEILKRHGFKYITTFANRKPNFVKI